MCGTAIVFGNGSAEGAMAIFPSSDGVLQDAFAAVIVGPEDADLIKLMIPDHTVDPRPPPPNPNSVFKIEI